jgi:cytochrome c oxidase subunit 4
MSQANAAAAEHKHHIVPVRVYFMVWMGLLFLTFLTVRVSYFDFGTGNLIVAITIATAKASLVALFFMGLKWDEHFNGLILLAALAFLGIFFVLTLADTTERGKVDPVESKEIIPVPGRADFMKQYGIEETPQGLPAAAGSTAADSTGRGSAAESTGAGAAGMEGSGHGGAAPDSTSGGSGGH